MESLNEASETNVNTSIGINASHVFNSINQCVNLARESKITKREIERHRKERDIAITTITEKCKVLREYMHLSFAERRKVIEECFERIDKGIENNDYQLIAMGFQLINNVVKDSPFKNIIEATPIQRTEMLENFSLD